MSIKHVHLLPNVITAFGLSCGLFVIFRMTMTPLGQVTEQLLAQSAGILLLAALADLLDGAIARAMRAESDFGGFFDSLADAITFGVGPSVVVLKTLSLISGTTLSFLLTTAALLFSVSGVLRLVRFNVLAQEQKRDEQQLALGKKFFSGLPIPASAAAIVSLNLFLASQELPSGLALDESERAGVLFVALTLLSYLMISRWKFPSLKNLHIRVASFRVLLLTVVAAAFIFYGLLHRFSLFFFAISWGYLFFSLAFAIYCRFFGDKTAESEEEDE